MLLDALAVEVQTIRAVEVHDPPGAVDTTKLSVLSRNLR
jgi:hypothetical protein